VHPDTELTAFVAGALAPAERARVAAHLESCADCRQAVEESRAVLARLAAGGPVPPPIGAPASSPLAAGPGGSARCRPCSPLAR
jgi:anti-sigma factor RsiW